MHILAPFRRDPNTTVLQGTSQHLPLLLRLHNSYPFTRINNNLEYRIIWRIAIGFICQPIKISFTSVISEIFHDITVVHEY